MIQNVGAISGRWPERRVVARVRIALILFGLGPLAMGEEARSAVGTDPAPAALRASRLEPLRFHSTSEITKNPELREKIDAIVCYYRLGTYGIGYAGGPSDIYQTFVEIAKTASHEELLALAFHEDPTMRANAIDLLFQGSSSAGIEALYPLLGDDSVVQTYSGCFPGVPTTVAERLVGSACYRVGIPEGRRQLLMTAVQDSRLGSMRGTVLSCIAPLEPAVALTLAARFIGDADPVLRTAAIRVAGAQRVEELYGDVIQNADHPAVEVQLAVAVALGQYALPGAEKPLKLMLNRHVALICRAAMTSLAQLATPAALGILEAHLRTARFSSEGVLAPLKENRSEGVLTFLRKVVAHSREEAVRCEAIRQLAASGDRASAPLIRRQITRGSISERREAIDAAGELGDRGAIPILEAIARGRSEYVAPARRALEKLWRTGVSP